MEWKELSENMWVSETPTRTARIQCLPSVAGNLWPWYVWEPSGDCYAAGCEGSLEDAQEVAGEAMLE